MTRLLGIDLGRRRIGVAVGDAASRTAAPFATLGRNRSARQDAAALVKIASEQGAGALVVGLPLDMDGGEGAQAVETREWAEAIARETGLPVAFQDERLTSERAERRIGTPPRGRNGGPPSAAQRDAFRARIDREAAALILQDVFDAVPAGMPAGGASGAPEPTESPRADLPRSAAAPTEAAWPEEPEQTTQQHEVETR